MKTYSFVMCLILALLPGCLTARGNAADLSFLRQPSLSQTQLVFTYGHDLWVVSRQGGRAHPLTTGPGMKSRPFISPDGKWVAYTVIQDGISSINVIPIIGGEPKRLTHYPYSGFDQTVGWTPDSRHVLMRSARNSYANFYRLFTVSIEGGLPRELPVPEGVAGSFSSDGKYLAYVPMCNCLPGIAWKHYRGGRTARIWIARLSDSTIERIPQNSSNDFNPMWLGGKIYFLSDRSGPVTLFSYDIQTRKVEQVLTGGEQDILWAAAAPGLIVYEQLGSLHILEIETGQSRELAVDVAGDLPEVQPHFINVGDHISNFSISPTGVRAAFEAHGEILTIPEEKGDIRNLTHTTGIAERDPAWSPDGRWIAYFSDESGEYALHLRSQDGAQARKIALGSSPSYFYSPRWSPDSKKIAYTDKRLNLWYLDINQPTPIKVDSDYYSSPIHAFDPSWSPDSQWLAYTRQLPSHMRALFVYSLNSARPERITDGMSDVRYPAFDPNGKYLYFTASTDSGPANAWLDLSSSEQPVTRAVYAIILRKELPSPLAEESDEEKIAAEKDSLGQANGNPDTKKTAHTGDDHETGREQGQVKKEITDVRFTIDFENINGRTIALPVPARNFRQLQAGPNSMIYLTDAGMWPVDDTTHLALYRFELQSRAFVKLLENISSFQVSFDGKKMLYASRSDGHKKWMIAAVPPASTPDATESPKVHGTVLKTNDLMVYVDPRDEWKQMYHEVWRIERDFFYDPNLHGINWKQMEKRYWPYLDALSSREDLNYLLTEVFGQFSVGHLAITGPRGEVSRQPETGLLGADYVIDHGRYRFAKIYHGENWNPELRSPLTEPGVDVHEGDYLLAINGAELTSSDEIFQAFRGTAGKSVVLTISSDPSGKGSRKVTVVPIRYETNLRNKGWIDTNRRKVDELSGGRIAYVYVPDTGFSGYSDFNRYFFAQLDKEGVILDERFNHGGAAPDYFIDVLRRPLLNYWMTREGHDFATPTGAIFGPKAMIINMYAGSGGDALSWYFRHEKLGLLVGTRTWGGLVGTYDYPQLMDGGEVGAPQIAFYNEKGEWEIENHGVAPDVEVDFLPQAWRQGRDPQLESAVNLVLEQMKKEPVRTVKRPAFPVYSSTPRTPALAQQELPDHKK